MYRKNKNPFPKWKAQTEVEHDASSGSAVLPQIGLMILSSTLVHLHIDRGFIRLNVTAADQLSPHRGDYRDQQLADFQNPAVQRRSADFRAEVSLQNHALPMQGRVSQYLLMTVSMTIRSLARHFSMISGSSGAETTPSSSHDRQARYQVRAPRSTMRCVSDPPPVSQVSPFLTQ